MTLAQESRLHVLPLVALHTHSALLPKSNLTRPRALVLIDTFPMFPSTRSSRRPHMTFPYSTGLHPNHSLVRRMVTERTRPRPAGSTVSLPPSPLSPASQSTSGARQVRSASSTNAPSYVGGSATWAELWVVCAESASGASMGRVVTESISGARSVVALMLNALPDRKLVPLGHKVCRASVVSIWLCRRVSELTPSAQH